MDVLLHIIETYGLWVVFVCVLLDQGGLPIPSYPPLIVTAALAVDANDSLSPILIVATLAALLADLLWFFRRRDHPDVHGIAVHADDAVPRRTRLDVDFDASANSHCDDR